MILSPRRVIIVFLHDLGNPGQVTRDSDEYIWKSQLGTSGPKGGDAGQVPAAVTHVAVERAAAVSLVVADEPHKWRTDTGCLFQVQTCTDKLLLP